MVIAFVRACTFENRVMKKKERKNQKNPDTLTGSHHPPPNRFWENQVCSDSAR
jgi:hypothetical protein